VLSHYLSVFYHFFFSQLVTQLSLNTWLQEFTHNFTDRCWNVCACAWIRVSPAKEIETCAIMMLWFSHLLLPKLVLLIEFVENKQNRVWVKVPLAMFSCCGFIWFYKPGSELFYISILSYFCNTIFYFCDNLQHITLYH